MKKTYQMLVYSPDNLSRSAFVSNFKKRCQFSVTPCAEKEAIHALVSNHQYDYILLDMASGEEGDDLIRTIRSSYCNSETYLILAMVKSMALSSLKCDNPTQFSSACFSKIFSR